MSKKVKGWIIWLIGVVVLTLAPTLVEAAFLVNGVSTNGAAYGAVIGLLWMLVVNLRYHII